ncbi:hypothetical protein LOTGIDRAFT_232519 [Lottia gigantea]|uniref:Uncharacterized protein n=1 Tax=Lottia gigantea TaxID=225164 RepID=V4AL04_LOTGI|nr:hypothetical protein LOTGIDRAFT_232519 [Lottia gigantea]ESO94281.1 hypothetical protein LOTGIDRAFT_232519 [Lottia gigantea]
MDVNRNEILKPRRTPKKAIRLMFLLTKRFSKDITKLVILFIVQFCVILPLFYWNVPWSAYFKIRNRKTNFDKLATEQNFLRVNGAKEYFKSLDPKSSLRWYDNVLYNHGNDLDMVVAIITMSRKKKQKDLGYLLQSTWKMDKIVKDQERTSIFTFVCNVDKDPSNFEEANYLRSYLPYVERFGGSRPHVADVPIPDTNLTFRNYVSKDKGYIKETIDYSFCLKVAKTRKSKYVLVLEDDAVARDDFLLILDHIFKYRFQHNINMPWAALKLYYPEKWTGYAYELDRLIELCSTGIVGSTIFTFLCYLILGLFKTFKKFNTYLFFTIGFIFTVCSCCAIGRQNILEFRRFLPFTYQVLPSPNCCTVAMLYHSSILDELSDSMYHNAFGQKMKADFALANFIQNSKLPAYMIFPSLFRHIGRISSLPKPNKVAVEFI